ncbi:MAG: hypothetical protein U5K31_14640 [Balneolaceae bacterium]|nr:hypothetical protein [Balneolaceae bacterium]
MYNISNQILRPLCLLLAGALGLAACTVPGGQGNDRALARVGGETLTLQQAREALPEHLLASDSLRALTSYRDEWVRSRLMSREAERLGLIRSEEVQRRLERARREVLSEALRSQIMRQFAEGDSVSNEEARNYFQTHREQFVLQERYVRFRHLETQTIEEARSARQQIMQGEPWPEVARRFGRNPEQAIGQSEQFWPVSMAAADQPVLQRYLEEVIGITEISPVRRLGTTYHFVQLMEAREAGEQPDLEWLMTQIKDWLRMEKRRRHFSSFVKNLYLKAESNKEVETFDVLETNLNFNTVPADTLESPSPND